MAASNPWEDFARLSQDLYRQQTDVAKSWIEGNTTFAAAGAGAGQGDGPAAAWGAEASAMADLWRSWFKLGTSFDACHSILRLAADWGCNWPISELSISRHADLHTAGASG